jgi:hypothetical protein
MGGATLPRKVVKAFRSAGATEEMIATAVLLFSTLPREQSGRARLYKTPKEADRAWYVRHKDRLKKKRDLAKAEDRRLAQLAAPPPVTHNPLPAEYVEAVGRTLIGTEMAPAVLLKNLDPLAVAVAETIVAALPPRVLSLRELLVNAAGGNVDREADVLTIRRLLHEGCDLEADGRAKRYR